MVTAILCVHNEGDLIAQSIGDLVAQGVSVYLIDHGSTDDTVAEAKPFLGRGLLEIESRAYDGRYAWREILERKQQLAAELPGPWFIHGDADELREAPWPGVPLVEAIAAVERAGYDAIDFAVFNFRPLIGGPVYQRGQDLRQAFTHFELGGDFDRQQVRCWRQPAGGVDLASSGGHDVQFTGRRVFPVRFILRHYPIRGQAHGERKVWQERVGHYLEEETARGWHVQYQDLKRGDSFLCDPATLTRFDAVDAGLSLALGHRGVEELQAQLKELRSQTHQALAGAEARERDARAQAQQALDHAYQELEQAHQQLEQAHQQLAQLRAERDRLLTTVAARDDEIERAARAIDEAEGRLDALLASRTWRWAAPMRLAWRALGRR